jgi:hypothetical protein
LGWGVWGAVSNNDSDLPTFLRPRRLLPNVQVK